MELKELVSVTLVGLLAMGSLLVWTNLLGRLRRGQPLTQAEPPHDVVWNGVDVLVLACVAFFLETAFLLWSASHWGYEISNTVDDTPFELKLASQSAARLVWLIAAIFVLHTTRRASRRDLGLDTSRLASDCKLGGLAFLAGAVPALAIQTILIQWYPSKHPLAEHVNQGVGADGFALTAVVAVLVAPLYEEFLFRVLIQGWFETWLRRGADPLDSRRAEMAGPASIVASSLLFAAMHLGYGPDPIPLFILALFFGYVYQRTHRIFPSLFAHMLLNGYSMLQLWLISPGAT